MADYTYTGVTTYIHANPANEARLRVLAEAFYVLQNFVNMHEPIQPVYQGILNSDAFNFLEDHAGMTSMEDCYFPTNTPEEYQNASVTEVVVKDQPMIRLYFPVVAKNTNLIDQLIHSSLRPILMTLFGRDLVGIKSKTALEFEDFAAAKESVIMSAQRSAAPASV